MTEKNTIIEVTNLCKSFEDRKVLHNLNIKVKEAESLVIIGRSGVGKSVMLKCLLKILNPDSGVIRINGKDVYNLNRDGEKQVYSKIGMLFQGAALFDSMTVWENVAFSLIHNEKMNEKHAYDLAVSKLKDVGLASYVAKKYPSELSGGMKKRVGLARAIANDPDIIFFDEPTTGLDPIMSDVINDLIRKSVRHLGATAVSITHDLASAKKIADRIAMLHDGAIIWEGKVSEIETTENEYVRQFVSGSAKGPIDVF